MRPHPWISTAGIVGFLRRESTQVALLMLFAFGLDLVGLYKPISIDEFGQIRVAQGRSPPSRPSFASARTIPYMES